MKYWLFKSDAECYSMEDFVLESKQTKSKVPWVGVRNYQARNFMREMGIGDGILFYQSGKIPAVIGVATVSGKVHADMSAQDPKDEHFDPKASLENPIWQCVDISFARKFKNQVTLADIKFRADLCEMLVAQRGGRLSIQPVSKKHFKRVVEVGGK